MKKSNNKKGFTLVELLVVIAILAILSVVSVVGYTSFTKKAQKADDISLTSQMNTILQGEEVSGEKFETAYDAVTALEDGGLDVTKLTPTTNGYHYVYDIKQNRMFLLDENKVKVAPSDKELTANTAYQFAFVSNSEDIKNFANYSYYLKSGFTFSTQSEQRVKKMDAITSTSTKNLTISNGAGVDVGDNKNVSITYTSSVSEDVIIRTTGDQASVTIKPSKDTSGSSSGSIKLYGFAKTIAVDTSAATTSTPTVAVAGACNELVVASGKIEVEETGVVFKAIVSSSATQQTVEIKNSGYVAKAVATTIKTTDTTVTVDTTATETVKNDVVTGDNTAGGAYKITSLAKLESFRDTVNAGANFEGETVELTCDITLTDGWTPIGEGNRDVAKTNTKAEGNFFKGDFDGKNHTIYNLNNKGFVPTRTIAVTEDNNGKTTIEYQYAYGLFALTENASFKNIKLANVDIDQSRYADVNMDSVGALVGYAKGNSTFENITASGTIKAFDSVGGIVGRWYGMSVGDTKEFTGVIKDCTNNVNVTANGYNGKSAGIVGFAAGKDGAKLTISVTNCTNNGKVTSYSHADALALIDGGTIEDGITLNVYSFTNNAEVTKGCGCLFANSFGTGKRSISNKKYSFYTVKENNNDVWKNISSDITNN